MSRVYFASFFRERIYFCTDVMREDQQDHTVVAGEDSENTDGNGDGTTTTPRSRSEDAVTWLLAYLSSGSVDASAETLATVEGMTLTPGAIRAVETARAAVDAVQKVGWEQDSVNKELQSRARDITISLAGVAASSYGHKYHPMVDVCAAMGLGESAGDPAVRLQSIAALSSDVLKLRADHARARSRLDAVRWECRVSARALSAALQASEELSRGIAERETSAAKAWERLSTYDAKTAEYDAATSVAKQQVRESGIDQSCTHDAVMALAKKNRQLKRDMDADKDAADAYLDLPPDLDLAKRKLRELIEEVREADEKIQAALNGFME